MSLLDDVGTMLPNLDAVNSVHECEQHVKELHALTDGIREMEHYAQLKSAACGFRLAGDIGSAQFYEDCCEASYKRLPPWAKW